MTNGTAALSGGRSRLEGSGISHPNAAWPTVQANANDMQIRCPRALQYPEGPFLKVIPRIVSVMQILLDPTIQEAFTTHEVFAPYPFGAGRGDVVWCREGLMQPACRAGAEAGTAMPLLGGWATRNERGIVLA
jgi:hypothetical protein